MVNVEYKITEYFEKNNLFDSDKSNGLNIINNGTSLIIKGSSRDLIELADLLANLALDKTKGAHVHLDDLTLINKESSFSEVIIEKDNK